jgi:hypothetical protein
MVSLLGAMRLSANFVGRRQVAYAFPVETAAERLRKLRPLPPEYVVRQPPDPQDADAIAALLHEEPSFGVWTGIRVRAELLDQTAGPRSATLVLYEGVSVACAFVVDRSTPRKRLAHAMFLYITPAHRNRSQLSNYVVDCTLAAVSEAGYKTVIGYTDPHRLSALLIYLSIGCRPIYDTIPSIWQWRRIQRRLAPALERLKRIQASKQGQASQSTLHIPPSVAS